MSDWIEINGVLVYEPRRNGLKKVSRMSKWWLVLEVSPGLAELQRHFLLRHRGIALQQTAFIPHVTILDGRTPVAPEFQAKWKKYQGRTIRIEVCLDIVQHWKFFTLPVRSPQLQQIRNELGFPEDPNLHITIGRLP